LPAKQAYLDGELCRVRSDGKTSFSLIQMASDTGHAHALVFFLFGLLYLDGRMISAGYCYASGKSADRPGVAFPEFP
jgi:bifunctional non-homologous end joining protein LigD